MERLAGVGKTDDKRCQRKERRLVSNGNGIKRGLIKAGLIALAIGAGVWWILSEVAR